MNLIKEYQILRDDFIIDKEDDPFLSGLIGPPTTFITTSLANLRSKQTTINPNFAAVMVDLLVEANLEVGDTVAIGMTASFPAINIALLSACKVLKIHPIIISSIGSSRWGATDPYFTWLDMERLLFNAGLIDSKSISASYGGIGDRGRGLKPEGKDFLWEAIYRNKINFINSENLSQSIQKRLIEYKNIIALNRYDAYINIGGGAASIGQSVNAKLIPSGVSYSKDVGDLIGNSVIKEFLNNNVTIVHIYNIIDLALEYSLKVHPEKFNDLGDGPIYSIEKYNLYYVGIALFIALTLLIGISLITHHQIKVRMSTNDTESLL
tara:strand:- start:1338 stop:2306 length:969 start_codon:yes stop_codon:yes gene_type:complete